MENRKELAESTLFVVTNHIYALLMINIYFVLCNSIFLFFFMTLQPSFSNIALYFLALIPTGPAISALIYATSKLMREKEISPSKDFFYGYKVNFKDTLKFWLPLLLGLFILFVDLQYFNSQGTGVYWILSILFLFAIVLLLAWSLYAFMINVGFKFRTRDICKLSGYYLFTKKKVTFGNISIVIITLFVTFLTTDFLLLFIGSLVCYLLLVNTKPVMEEVKSDFCEEQ